MHGDGYYQRDYGDEDRHSCPPSVNATTAWARRQTLRARFNSIVQQDGAWWERMLLATTFLEDNDPNCACCGAPPREPCNPDFGCVDEDRGIPR
jgi:hypothetical protein